MFRIVRVDIMLCEYGCGREAKHQFKNGKWCCNKNISLCSNIKNIISDRHKGKKLSKEHKKKLSNVNKGKKASPATRVKMSLAKKGKRHPNYKKTFSGEHKKNISLSVRGEKNHNYWKRYYIENNIPLYDTYANQLTIEEAPQRSKEDKNILTVICNYCKKRFTPSVNYVRNRVRSIKGTSAGECRLYCCNKCKNKCSIFNRSKHTKDQEVEHAREVQPELRQMRLEIDDYTCQKCEKHQDELDTGLHCHHIEGVRWEPLESADVDKVITLCKKCHEEIHSKEGCRYKDMKCEDSIL